MANIFTKLARSQESIRIGCPEKNEGERLRRWNAMASMNPNGFRTPKSEPRKDAQGKTRGMRKRELAARYRDLVKASQQAERERREAESQRLRDAIGALRRFA